MNVTPIQWTWAVDPATGALIPMSGWTWNPLVGCRKVSGGCKNCYAERLIATRLSQHHVYKGLAVMKDAGPQFTGEHRLIVDRLDEPLRKRNPRGGLTFVNDLGDLFFEGHTNEEIAAVFGVMAAAHWHTFQVLTRRVKRMAEWFAWVGQAKDVSEALVGRLLIHPVRWSSAQRKALIAVRRPWPLPNVWLGVSTEDQATADERIPRLLRCPARVRFLSVEPQIGPIDYNEAGAFAWKDKDGFCQRCGLPWSTRDTREPEHREVDGHVCPPGFGGSINWVIDGGESGPNARPFELAWTRSTQAQCKAASVAYFRKQLGAHPFVDIGGERLRPPGILDSHGGNEDEWPADLRGCRAFPVPS